MYMKECNHTHVLRDYSNGTSCIYCGSTGVSVVSAEFIRSVTNTTIRESYWVGGSKYLHFGEDIKIILHK